MTGEPEIESVEAIGLEADLDGRFGYAQGWIDKRSSVLVRVVTSDGHIGWGESWGPVAGTVETIDEVLGPAIVGRDPTAVERLYDELVELARSTYQAVVPYPAISGIDTALWDLKGQILDTPVSTLLGGRRTDTATAYATGHYFSDTPSLDAQIESIVTEATSNAEQFDIIKLRTGLSLLDHDATADIKLVRAVREAVSHETQILVDANYAYDRPTAKTVGGALEEMGVYWFEEPVHPEVIEDYVAIRESLGIRIAGGECHAPPEFRRLLSAGGLDVAQPDVSIIGGLTAARRIVHRARDAGVVVVPHVWGTTVGIAATLQLLSTVSDDPWIELDRSPNPIRDALWPTSCLERSGDRIPVPEAPGIGVNPDLSKVDHLRVDR
jgi:D-galactarolactone cycloisomerase